MSIEEYKLNIDKNMKQIYKNISDIENKVIKLRKKNSHLYKTKQS